MIKFEKKILYFIFSLIILDLIILSFINRKSLCVQSHFVNEVSWYSKSKPNTESTYSPFLQSEPSDFTVFSCNTKKKVLYNDEYVDNLNKINYRLSKLESKIATLSDLKKINLNLSIHIYKNINLFLKINSNEILISEDLLTDEKSDEFSRAIIKSWVFYNQRNLGLNLFRLETTTDLLMRIFKLNNVSDENIKWQNLIERPKFIFSGASFASWCQSPLMQVEYESICSEDIIKSGAAISLSSLSIVKWFSNLLYNAFTEIKVEDQIYFYKQLAFLIEELSEQVGFLDPLQKDSIDFNSVSEQKKFINTEIINWINKSEKIGLKNFSQQLERMRLKLEIPLNEKTQNLDFIFYQSKPFSKQQIEAFNYLTFIESDYSFLGLTNEGFWFWPFIGFHGESVYDIPLQAKYIIYQSCELPTVQSLLGFQRWTQRVLWVQDCDLKDNHLALHGFLHRGIQYFSLDNAKVNFMLLFLPSLNYLIQKNKKISHGAFAFKSMRENPTNYLAELAGWTTPLWNHKARAYEVKSTIGLVEWFKFTNDFWPEILIK